MTSKSKRSRSGFTLIELMVTVTLLGIMVMLASPGYSAWRANSRAYEQAHSVALLGRLALNRAREEGIAHMIGVDLTGATPRFDLRRGLTRRCRHNAWTQACAVDAQSIVAPSDFAVSPPLEVLAQIGPVATDQLDICYEPGGRAYVRNNEIAPPSWVRMALPVRFIVQRSGGLGARTVDFPPAGTPGMYL